MLIGRYIIIIGCLLVVLGALLVFFPKIFNWFGNLPGDIRIERENSRLYIPLGSMIVISIVLTLILNGAGWLWNFLSRLK
jgi:hypothetical protein